MNYQIYNSYKIWDEKAIEDTMFWLKSYNDRQGRKQFNRSVESLKAEWYEHNFLYYILPGEQDKKDAMHADLDENGKGTYNNYLPFG